MYEILNQNKQQKLTKIKKKFNESILCFEFFCTQGFQTEILVKQRKNANVQS